jgi:hypothetical protein
MFILSQLIGCALALTVVNITHPRS